MAGSVVEEEYVDVDEARSRKVQQSKKGKSRWWWWWGGVAAKDTVERV
jgi:hypothetical protein